jgi:predicted PurR-regulated permease PerM
MVPFLFGLVLAYLLLPLIKWSEIKLPYPGRWPQAKRIILILLIFVIILGLFGLFAFFIVTALIESFSVLLVNAPQYFTGGLSTLNAWLETIRDRLPVDAQLQLDDYISNLGTTLGATIQAAFATGISFIPRTFGMIFGFISLPLFLFYILKDSKQLSGNFYSFLPSGMALHARKIFFILDTVLGRYIRAQLLLGTVVGVLVFTGLSVLGIELAPALAVFAGITELIPIVGPWIGGVAGVIVTLAVAPDKAIWAAVMYVVIQQLENVLLVPRIQGGYLKINPAILIVLLVLGAKIAGIWGMILIAPLTSVIVEIYKYVQSSVQMNGAEQSLQTQ